MRWAVLVLMACSGPATAPPVVAHQAPLTTPRALAGYPSVLEPAATDCTVSGPWGPEQPRELRLGPGGSVFATVYRSDGAKLELAGARAFAELTVGGFRLWGDVDGAHVHPARAFVHGGFLVPGSHAQLRPVAARASLVTVDLAPPDFVKAMGPVRDVRRCDELGLAAVELHLSTLFQPQPHGVLIPAGVALPIMKGPGGPPVAELAFEEETLASVVGTRGDFVRIFVDEGADTAVLAWVARSRVAPGGASGQLGGGGRGLGPPTTSGLSRAPRHVTCTRDVPLVIELGGTQHLVGAIGAGTKFGVAEEVAAELVAITFDRVALVLAPGARPLVKRTALESCADVPR